MTGTPVVVRDAVVRFGARTALDGVSMTAQPGQVTAVVGGDGAGKTTLLRAIVGRVGLSGGSIEAPQPHEIGYLPATTGSWRDLTVQENVDFVGGSYGLAPDVLAERASRVLSAAGLEPYRDRTSRQLSGGMRRKLGVCLALLHDPTVLVLDEPSTGVDPVSRVDLWRLAAQAAAAGATVVMSTTYLDEAERASQVLVLDRGSALVAGPPAAIVGDFDQPLTQNLHAIRPEWAWRRGRTFREVWPTDPPPPDLAPIAADLEDVVIARTLLRANGRGRG
jgi:ABC-type multidrug transport system ATPase subunit